jgi:drug/metabolite transporter (DMT)-like permease
MLGGLAMWTLEEWRPVSPLNVLWLAMAGLLVSSANYCMITAFRHVDVSVISPFRYSVILWAGLSGFLVFGERPDWVAAAGAVLIAGSGLYTVHRERLRARAERAGMASKTGAIGPAGVK